MKWSHRKIRFIFRITTIWIKNPGSKNIRVANKAKKVKLKWEIVDRRPWYSNYFLSVFFFPDDPYYCGLRARIPNFAKSKAQRDRESTRMASQHPQQPQQNSQQPQQPPINPGVHHPMAAWHHGGRGKSNGYSCQDFNQLLKYESDYSHIYGRLPVPTRGFRQYPPPRGQIYVSEWE